MKHGETQMILDDKSRDEFEMTMMAVLERMFERVNMAEVKSFKLELTHDEVFDCPKIRAIAETED